MQTLQTLVDNWLTDIQRRGAELYATNRGDEVQYFSFEGKDHLTFSVEIDYAVQDIKVHITDPKSSVVEIKELALTQENLDALARRICPVQSGQAVIPTYLLAQLAILCHAYQRLVQEFDRLHKIQTSTQSVAEIEAELRRFLTPEEQQRTDNPLLKEARSRKNRAEQQS